VLALFAHLFVPERHHQRAGAVGFAVPAFSEIEFEHGREIEPLLATNMRNTFVRTRVSTHGHARFGFSECEVDHEGYMLCEFYRVLVETIRQEGWKNIASSVPTGIDLLRSLGFVPKLVVTPIESAVDLPDGVYQVVADLPTDAALVMAPAPQVGLYTRVGNHMGLLAYRVDRALVAVVP
jgi:hypothetical protein